MANTTEFVVDTPRVAHFIDEDGVEVIDIPNKYYLRVEKNGICKKSFLICDELKRFYGVSIATNIDLNRAPRAVALLSSIAYRVNVEPEERCDIVSIVTLNTPSLDIIHTLFKVQGNEIYASSGIPQWLNHKVWASDTRLNDNILTDGFQESYSAFIGFAAAEKIKNQIDF